MSATIKILPQFIANRIAAGEVVGRPEAVVKELIENSIDAKAKSITLRIKDSGKSLIQVTDDGFGMSEEDALLCFQRHSTSKISTTEDLENIITLGFRGEALASICAVAQVELITGKAANEMSTSVKNQGSEILETSVVSGSKTIKGTSILVKNLFFNTPARRNFLKSNQTEFKHIYDTFIRFAVAYPEISFNFINDDEEIFDLKKTNGSDLYSGLRNRLIQIYGVDYAESLIEVENKTELISIMGFTAKPSFTKKTKQDQYLFLNRRYFVNKSISYAVHLAYEDLIEKGDYPSFFLFLSLDPKRFDVNVHPSKLEVKFDDEKAIFGFLKKSVWSALDKNNLIIGIKLDDAKSTHRTHLMSSGATSPGSFQHGNKFPSFQSLTKNTGSNIHELFDNKGSLNQQLIEPTKNKGSENFNFQDDDIDKKTSIRTHVDILSNKISLWQFQKKYIIYQLENTLMIIDQHAAHERILYEQAIDRLNSSANLSQQLLIPIYVELNPVDYDVVKGIEKELRSLGFDLEMQVKKIKLTGIPSDVHVGNEAKILQEMVDEYKENEVKLNLEKRDNLAKSYACKHAIRTGDKLKEDEMLNLIDKLFSTKMPYVCPHGRPTIIKIAIEELDKKFARTGF